MASDLSAKRGAELVVSNAINAQSQRTSIFAMGSNLLKGFAVEMMAIGAPGMIAGRGIGGLDVAIQRLGIHHFRLTWRLLVNCVG